MPIEVKCPSCQRKFRVPDKAAGKRIKCPKCTGAISVPAGQAPAASGGAPASTAPAVAPAPSTPAPKSTPAPTVPAKQTPAASLPDAWHVKTGDGETYGPVTKAELDEWVAESRVDADSQLLQEGTENWQAASAVYPQLAAPSPAAAADAAAASDNPFDFAAADAGPTSRFRGGPQVTATKSATKKSKAPSSTGGGKSKTVAGILGLCLGAFGVHRFYLGYTGIGIIQIVVTLFTCVGGWWGVIEGIMILAGAFKTDANGNPLE